MKKLICNIVSFTIATVILFMPLSTWVWYCIASAAIDFYFHRLTFYAAIVAFYLVIAVFFALNVLKKDKFDLYKWSCLVFFVATFCTIFLNPNSYACFFNLYINIKYDWPVFFIISLLIICAVLPFVPFMHFSRRPSKTARMQAQIDELQKQVDELKKGE